jgi:AAA domain
MFTRRNEPDLHGNPGLQDSLREALREPGGQILLYGDTGVGKSTLLQYAAEDEDMGYVSVECASRWTFEEHIDAAIRELVTQREIETVEEATSDRGGEAGISTVITLRGQITDRRGETRRFEAIHRAPLLALTDAMRESDRRLLAFDNFQNVAIAQRSAFAQAIEVLSDRSKETGDIKMVIIGIAEDAQSLIRTSGSVQRRTSEIGVPRMPDGELEDIFANGFRLLFLEGTPKALERLVFFCDGFPYFAHLLGLNVARHARRYNEDVVDDERVEAALARAARDVSASFPVRIRNALEAGGRVQPRRRILHVLSLSDGQEWLGAEVIEEYIRFYGDPGDPGFLYVALGQLAKSKHGAVLARSGTRKRYRYRFSDPYLRPYLRMTYFTQPFQMRLL